MLTAARVVQGFGGAMMMPVGRLALVRSFDKSEFVNAMSYATIPGLIGPALGPLLGGFFSMYLSWRMIFFVNIPFGIAGLWLTRRFMPDLSRPGQACRSTSPASSCSRSVIGGVSWALEHVTDGDYLQAAGASAAAPRDPAGLMCAAVCASPHRSSISRLLRIPSFRIAFNGGFATRLGVGGIYLPADPAVPGRIRLLARSWPGCCRCRRRWR